MIRLGAAVALLLAGSAAAQEVPRDYIVNLERGVELQLQNKHSEAISYFARARRAYPQDWRGHALQALSLIEMARVEEDPVRKDSLYKEARAMQGPLVKEAGMKFDSPLRYYLNGLEAAGRGEADAAYQLFLKAYRYPDDAFRKYEPIQLKANVRVSYALVALDVGTRFLGRGRYEEANKLLDEADRLLPKDDPRRLALHANLAVAKEGIGQFQTSIENLRKCESIARGRGEKKVADEAVASIALSYVILKEPEKAKETLKELPADTRIEKAIEARCGLKRLETQRNPELLFETLAYYREQIALYPEAERQRLVVPYAELVTGSLSRRQAEEHRALVDQTIEMLEKERQLHPECPAPYWFLSKLYAMIGEDEKAAQLQRLHEKKKSEYENAEKFDARGRARCAGSA